jgi:hypothetical protein
MASNTMAAESDSPGAVSNMYWSVSTEPNDSVAQLRSFS